MRAYFASLAQPLGFDGDDVAQDVAIRVIQQHRRQPVTPPGKPLILKIARCVIADHCPARRKWPQEMGECDPAENDAPVSLGRAKTGNLTRLRPQAREILERRFCLGQDVREIATELGMSIDGINSSLRRSRRTLEAAEPSRN